MAQRKRTHPKAYWTAGHLIDGQVDGALAAECSTCGSTSGVAIVNEKLAQRRKAERLEARRTPRTW